MYSPFLVQSSVVVTAALCWLLRLLLLAVPSALVRFQEFPEISVSLAHGWVRSTCFVFQSGSHRGVIRCIWPSFPGTSPPETGGEVPVSKGRKPCADCD